MDPDSFFANVPFAEGAQILQQEENTLTLLVDRKGPVKLSFFWGLKVGRLSHPEETRDGVLIVASMQDLFAHKLKVILQRVDVKDYQDIAAILEAGYPLSMGISGAKSLWPRFPVMDCLRTLCYFKEGNFQALSVETRKQLITASAGVESGQICEMNVSYPLSPSDPPHRPQKGGSGL